MKYNDPYSHRRQEIFLILAALNQLQRPRPRSEVIDYIESQNWIDFQKIDRLPYQSSLTGEPRWRTSIASAKKDCTDFELMEPDTDVWIATSKGKNLLPKVRSWCSSREFDKTKCWYLSIEGKQLFDSTYLPSEADTERPENYYKDEKPTTTDLLKKYMDFRTT